MAVKVVTVEQNKKKRIAKKLADLKKDFENARKEGKGREVEICEARHQYYINGLNDAYGYEKTLELINMAEEVLKQD